MNIPNSKIKDLCKPGSEFPIVDFTGADYSQEGIEGIWIDAAQKKSRKSAIVVVKSNFRINVKIYTWEKRERGWKVISQGHNTNHWKIGLITPALEYFHKKYNISIDYLAYNRNLRNDLEQLINYADRIGELEDSLTGAEGTEYYDETLNTMEMISKEANDIIEIIEEETEEEFLDTILQKESITWEQLTSKIREYTNY